MKKIKSFLLVVALILILPFCVSAEDKDPVNVYIFTWTTCPHCKAAKAFFNELKEDDEYKDLFNLVDYETGSNEDNQALAEKVAEAFDEDFDGVPYIVIGEKTFSGYVESWNEDIKTAIRDYYDSDNREDVVATIRDGGEYNKKSNSTDTIIAIAIIVVALAGFGYIVYLSRKDEKPKSSKKTHKEKKVIVKEDDDDDEYLDDDDIDEDDEIDEDDDEENEEVVEEESKPKQTKSKTSTNSKNQTNKKPSSKKNTKKK